MLYLVKLNDCYGLLSKVQYHFPIISPLCTIFHYFYALYLGQPSTFIYRQLYSLLLALFLGLESCIIRLFIQSCQQALFLAVKQPYILPFLYILGIILCFQPVQYFCFCLSRFLCVFLPRGGGGGRFGAGELPLKKISLFHGNFNTLSRQITPYHEPI